MKFDPNSAATDGSNIFGLPFKEEEAVVVYLPVPWEATTSYGAGTAAAPAAILEASRQVDLYDFDVLRPYEPGLFMRPEPKQVRDWNRRARAAAKKVIAAGGTGESKALQKSADAVNALSEKLNAWVYGETSALLDRGKIVGIVGGDHSTPYGAIRAAAESHPGLGLLHFDAHHDLREAYEGFTHSHASIFYNVLKDTPEVGRLVQVGVRDFCEDERSFCASQGRRVSVFYDGDLARRRFSGEPWAEIAAEIVAQLPETVWVTVDIDGLDPRFCPNTGTPVPGGIDFRELNHVLGEVARSGRRIVGFDLVEVAPGKDAGQWDANVGARLLYKLSAWALASQGRVKLR